MKLTRRDFLRSGIVLLSGLAAGSLPHRALSNKHPDGPFGPLNAPDDNNIRLPDGFKSRIVAVSRLPVPETRYEWHIYPDGGAVFAAPDSGWIYVSNSEAANGMGGVSAIRFSKSGEILDAYPILDGTSLNCSGGPTPWGSWLSCEEHAGGQVWQCDPLGIAAATPIPSMGVFQHEAAAVNPDEPAVYLTEDLDDGCFYRFVPDSYPKLHSGRLEVAMVSDFDRVLLGRRSHVAWVGVPDPSGNNQPTRYQVRGATTFNGGEGTWQHQGVIYFTTKGDDRVWAYDPRERSLKIFYEASWSSRPMLTGGDNITGLDNSLFVAEDGGNLEVVALGLEGEVGPVLRLVGREHVGSEVAGVAFNPSGNRLYFSSQRAFAFGATYEVQGPFRRISWPSSEWN